MKKLFTLLTLAICLFALKPSQATAQSYNTAIGIRLGYHYGLSVKHFMKSNMALEGIFSTRGYGNKHWDHFGWNLTGLLKWQNQFATAKGLSWYAGIGAHIGRWHAAHYDKRWNDNAYHFVFGLDGVLGLEFAIPSTPIALSLDWKPAFDMVGGSHFIGDGFALTFRFGF